MPNRRFFTANQLKAIALFCMLLDHMWATIVPGREWMTCVGRIAFPIFAFELAQGYTHTHDLRAYAKRLLLLAVVSEVPFDMVVGGTYFYPWHQNVAWTLLAGLWACHCADRCRTAPTLPEKLPPLLGHRNQGFPARSRPGPAGYPWHSFQCSGVPRPRSFHAPR